MLYICGGLPATGKSTLSQLLAKNRQAAHLRIDVIEQALRETGLSLQGPEGYVVAYRLAEHLLRLGMSVVADSVNPIEMTRAAWRNVAAQAQTAFVEIEFICADASEHRLRVETRPGDIAGLQLPTWEAVVNREYEPWIGEHLVIDTAKQTIEQSLFALQQALDSKIQTPALMGKEPTP
jgi:predicted kinase